MLLLKVLLLVMLLKVPLFFFAFLDDLGNFKQQKKLAAFSKVPLLPSHTFECTTNSRTVEVQAHYHTMYLYLNKRRE